MQQYVELVPDARTVSLSTRVAAQEIRLDTAAVDDAAVAVGHRNQQQADARDQNDRSDGVFKDRHQILQQHFLTRDELSRRRPESYRKDMVFACRFDTNGSMIACYTSAVSAVGRHR